MYNFLYDLDSFKSAVDLFMYVVYRCVYGMDHFSNVVESFIYVVSISVTCVLWIIVVLSIA